jgi:hypothetical protein
LEDCVAIVSAGRFGNKGGATEKPIKEEKPAKKSAAKKAPKEKTTKPKKTATKKAKK